MAHQTQTATVAAVLIGVEETAALLNVPVATLRWMRHKGEGPRGVSIGGRIKWKREEVLAWIDQQFAEAEQKHSA